MHQCFFGACLTEYFEAPEGPHIYRKDGYYYLLAAEGTFIFSCGIMSPVNISQRWHWPQPHGDYGQVVREHMGSVRRQFSESGFNERQHHSLLSNGWACRCIPRQRRELVRFYFLAK